MPKKYGRIGTMRPFGPRGFGKVHRSSAICGASRLATAHADGGFQISADLPEINARLLDASSKLTVSAGRKGISRLAYSITAFTLSESAVMLPLASTRSAPNAPNVAPQVWFESVVGPQPSANP